MCSAFHHFWDQSKCQAKITQQKSCCARRSSGKEFQTMGPCTANARRPTVDSRARCRGTTISCCVADLRRCLPTTSVTAVQQSTRYCGALPCRHLCMMTPSLYAILDLPHRAIVGRHARFESGHGRTFLFHCGSVHSTLQGVSDRLRGSSKYIIALVNAGGHECMNKCSRWLRVKWSSDTSELTEPVKRCCGHVGHVTLQTQVWRDGHSEQTDVVCAVTVSTPSWRDGPQPVREDWPCLDPAQSSPVFSVFNFSRLADIHWLTSVMQLSSQWSIS